MKTYHVYVKSPLSLDELAFEIRSALNVNSINKTPSQVDQKRFGLNMGGDYYLFEFIGLNIHLVANRGEVIESDFSDYGYYLIIYSDNNVKLEVIEYLSVLINKIGCQTFIQEID